MPMLSAAVSTSLYTARSWDLIVWQLISTTPKRWPFESEISTICSQTALMMSDFPVPDGPYRSMFGGRSPGSTGEGR